MSRLASTLSRIRRTQPASQTRTVYLGSSLLAIAGIGYSIDRYVYANALSRTVRLAYNAGLTILDYKINFNPDSSPDKLHERVAQRISEVCIKNGGLYIKLGQSIAIQAAILPTPYKKSFEKMFDSSNPLPFEDVLKVWNAEFPGSSLDSYFDFFDKIPVACGSIAQVHRAKLKNSDQVVAVKIQRPDIPIQMELDLFAYRTLLYVYQNVFELPVYFIAHYVSDQIRKETDFINEARNSERTATLIKEDSVLKDKIYVPKVYWPLTTTRILTTEYIESGSRLTDVDSLESKGFTKKEVMDTAMKLFTQMLFTFGWLHCDLHPGNILVFEHKSKLKLALIDHGLYIHLPDQFRRDYCELWRSLFVLDTDSIERIAQGWGIANSDLFASATLLRPFKARAPSVQDGPLRGSPNSGYESSLKIKETMKTILENEALIPQELIFIVRCMRMMQGNNQVLGSPTNRINILAHGAAAGMMINAPPPSSLLSAGVGLPTVIRGWVEGIVKLWKFRTVLILVDIGFFFTQVRQWWLTQVIGDTLDSNRNRNNKKSQEGFEDILQRQLENLAKEEFGVTLDDSAFMG
ncbi:hypothetical protein MJO29_014533 [Puccinia striiformis f. sp. tritici]|nr:hypothetical protein Pst134EA_033150 [Puccinia striiformis f. sp. tritici]KAH9450403.1 hypothetical protein Pst134EA_033150 [Puccinia striiformis f. sp. tritici]KAI7939797.1 hypothetical protein MJO29_014533 [Puccinia striiformis f. sp. tritici]KAI9624012.1 hypothetical protein H4Q26_017023 [Puccinia striiformis f. sp. tritici PST-130]